MEEKLNELKEEFKKQVRETKLQAQQILTELKSLIEESKGDSVTLSNDEIISKDILSLFNEKLEDIINMKVSLSKVPTLCLDDYNKSLWVYYDLELAVARISDIKYDIMLASLK